MEHGIYFGKSTQFCMHMLLYKQLKFIFKIYLEYIVEKSSRFISFFTMLRYHGIKGA